MPLKLLAMPVCIRDDGLACSLSFFKDEAADRVAGLALMSGMDPMEETETERTGLESLDLEPRKEDDFCRGTELRRANMTPVFEDKVRESLQPAKIGCKNTGGLHSEKAYQQTLCAWLILLYSSVS